VWDGPVLLILRRDFEEGKAKLMMNMIRHYDTDHLRSVVEEDVKT